MSPSKPSIYERIYPWVIIAFLAFIPVIAHGMLKANASKNNNVRQWLPADDATATYEHFYEHFGTDEFALVSWEGCTLDDPRLEKFVTRLKNHRVEISNEEQNNKKGELKQVAQQDDKPAANHSDQQDNQHNNDGDRLFAKVTTGPSLLNKLTSSPFDLDRDEAFRRLQGIVISHDGNLTCAVVQLTKRGDANRLGTVETLRQLAAEETGLPSAEVHMVGDSVTNAEVDIASEQAIQGLLWLSAIVAFGFALISLRNLRLVFIVFITAIYCGAMAESLVGLLGGQMNLVLVVMPVLIYVLSLSAGIHIVNYFRDAVEESGQECAALRAIQHGWLPCTMAAGTTAIGLGSLYVSKIVPVRDFGLYSALGILVSLLAVFLFLPSLLVAMQKIDARFGWEVNRKPRGGPEPTTAFQRGLDGFAGHVTRNHIVTALACGAILVLCGWGTQHIKTAVKPLRFFNAENRLVKDYKWLQNEQRLGPQIPIELVIKFDSRVSSLGTLDQMRLVNDLQQNLHQEKGDLIGSTMSAITFAPDLDAGPRQPFSVNERLLNERLAENRQAYREAHFYSSEPLADNGLRELWRISARVRDVGKEYDVVIREVQSHVTQFLDQRRRRYEQHVAEANRRYEQSRKKSAATYEDGKQAFTDDPAKLAKLHQNYADYLFNLEKERKRRLGQLVNDTPGVDVDYTGMIPLFYAAQNQLLAGLRTSFVIAFGLIAVLMVIWFRSMSAGLATMLPNVFPAAVVFGCMGWSNTSLLHSLGLTTLAVDIGSMMTASVAMGIAVDDTVHFLTWFRRGSMEGKSRVESILYAYRRCAVAMTQTTAIAGLGLLVFHLSSFQPVSQFGFLMFVLLAAALLGDLIFLPALLAGPAGRLFMPHQEEAAVPRAKRQAVA